MNRLHQARKRSAQEEEGGGHEPQIFGVQCHETVCMQALPKEEPTARSRMASYHHAALATVGVCPAAQKPCATRRATQALCPETNEACGIRQPPYSWCVALWLKCRSRRAERAMAQWRRDELSSHGVHLHPCSGRTWFEQNCMGNKQPGFEPGQRAKGMTGGKVSKDRKSMPACKYLPETSRSQQGETRRMAGKRCGSTLLPRESFDPRKIFHGISGSKVEICFRG